MRLQRVFPLPRDVKEEGVEPVVSRQLGVESHCYLVVLAHSDDATVHPG